MRPRSETCPALCPPLSMAFPRDRRLSTTAGAQSWVLGHADGRACPGAQGRTLCCGQTPRGPGQRPSAQTCTQASRVPAGPRAWALTRLGPARRGPQGDRGPGQPSGSQCSGHGHFTVVQNQVTGGNSIMPVWTPGAPACPGVAASGGGTFPVKVPGPWGKGPRAQGESIGDGPDVWGGDSRAGAPWEAGSEGRGGQGWGSHVDMGSGVPSAGTQLLS